METKVVIVTGISYTISFPGIRVMQGFKSTDEAELLQFFLSNFCNPNTLVYSRLTSTEKTKWKEIAQNYFSGTLK